MSVTATALRELHRIHTQLFDLRERLQRGPKQVRAGEANVDSSKDKLVAAQSVQKRSRMIADDKQVQLKAAEDRIDDIKRKRNACSTNREYQTLMEQIAADEMATSVLSDEILEVWEKVEEQEKGVLTSADEMERSEAELAKLKERVEAEKQKLEVDVARLGTDLTRAEVVLPVEFKSDYDRMIKARGEKALAEVENDCCSGCYQMITSQMLNELKLSRPVFCKSCGCLIYLPEDASVDG